MLARLVTVLAAAAALLATAAPAHALTPAPQPDWLHSEITRDGGSALSSWAGPSVTTSWQSCAVAPDGFRDCTPLGPVDPPLGWLVMRPQESGRMIVATTNDGRTGTALYRGPISAGERPAVTGSARVGARVRAIAGSWNGGFGNEASHLQLQVCRDRAGDDCLVIADDVYANNCDATGTTLPARYAGWRLRAVEIRTSQFQPYAMLAYPSPELIGAARPATLVSASPLSEPIRPGHGSDGGCQPRALASARLPRRAAGAGDGGLTVAQVACVRGCRVVTTVRRGEVTMTVRTRIASSPWRGAVVLPQAAAQRLGAGPLDVAVTTSAGGALAERGTVVLPARLLTTG